MKNIYKFELAIPLLLVKTKITHTTPRKPTVFERLILDLSLHKDSLKDYQTMSLLTIFINILKIPDADELLRPAFENLVNLQILNGYYDDLSRLTLSDIRLQSNSNVDYLIKNGQIPAHPKEDIVSNIYHPVRGELVSNIKCETRKQHVIPTLPESLIGFFYPDKLIRDELTPKKQKWLTSTSEIINVSEVKEDREFQYTNTELGIGFDGQKLKFISADDVLNKFINNISADLRLNILNSVVKKYNNQAIDADEITSEEILSLDESVVFMNNQLQTTSLSNIKSTNHKLLSDSKVLIFSNSDLLQVNLPEVQALLTIECSSNEKSEIHWVNGKAHLILSDFNLPLGTQWLEGDFLTSTMYKKQIADLQLLDMDGNQHNLRMSGESKLSANSLLYKNILEHLNALAEQSNDYSWQNLSVFLKPANELWREWLNQPVKSSIEESIVLIKERHQLLATVNGKAPGEMINDLFQWLKNELKLEAPLSKAKLMMAAEYGKLIGLEDKKNNLDFFAWLQENSQLPGNYFDLAEYAQFTEPFGSVRPNSYWLHPKLLSDWQASCGLASFSKVLDYLPVAEALNNLHESLIGLRTVFSDNWLRFMGDKQALVGLVREAYFSVNHQIYLEKLRSYQRNYDKQIQLLAAYPIQVDANQGKPLIYSVKQAVDIYLDEILKPDFVLEAATKVFVVDSCFLIKKPDLPKLIRQGEVLLVPDKVHEELDNLKAKNKNQGVVVSASKAIKALADNKFGNVLTIQADLDNLPASYERSKPDNHILAAVLTYRKFSPILLTDDKNFINKARGLEIPSLTVEEYLNGVAPSTELSSAIKKLESLKE